MSLKRKNYSQKGVAQIPLIIGLLVIGLALPAAMKLVQERQEVRKEARSCYYSRTAGMCYGGCASGYTCTKLTSTSCYCKKKSGPAPTSRPTSRPTSKPSSKSCDGHPHGSRWCERDKVKRCDNGVTKHVETCSFNCSGGKCVSAPTPKPQAPYKYVKQSCDTSTGKFRCSRQRSWVGWDSRSACENSPGCSKVEPTTVPAGCLSGGTICYSSGMYSCSDCCYGYESCKWGTCCKHVPGVPTPTSWVPKPTSAPTKCSGQCRTACLLNEVEKPGDYGPFCISCCIPASGDNCPSPYKCYFAGFIPSGWEIIDGEGYSCGPLVLLSRHCCREKGTESAPCYCSSKNCAGRCKSYYDRLDYPFACQTKSKCSREEPTQVPQAPCYCSNKSCAGRCKDSYDKLYYPFACQIKSRCSREEPTQVPQAPCYCSNKSCAGRCSTFYDKLYYPFACQTKSKCSEEKPPESAPCYCSNKSCAGRCKDSYDKLYYPFACQIKSRCLEEGPTRSPLPTSIISPMPTDDGGGGGGGGGGGDDDGDDDGDGGCKPCPDGSFAAKGTTSYNCKTDGKQLDDFIGWKEQYLKITYQGETIPENKMYANYDCENGVDIGDFILWLEKYLETI